MSGRKQALEWTEVFFRDNKCFCQHCNAEVSKKIERIRAHLKKCTRRPAEKTRRITSFMGSTSTSTSEEDDKMDLDDDHVSEPASSSTTSTLKTSKPPEKRLKTTKLSNYYSSVATTKKDKEDATNTPFKNADHPCFLKMIALLRPGYQPPNRLQVGGILLIDSANKLDAHIIKAIETTNAPITVVQDGWSNVKNDPILATSIQIGRKSFLISTIDCGDNQKTSEYCANVALEQIKNIEDKYGKKVAAVCTDNENKMLKMRKMVR